MYPKKQLEPSTCRLQGSIRDLVSSKLGNKNLIKIATSVRPMKTGTHLKYTVERTSVVMSNIHNEGVKWVHVIWSDLQWFLMYLHICKSGIHTSERKP